MQRIVECVPNISEGRDQKIIDDVVNAARVGKVQVLDVDAGRATNRTVITLAGDPEEILEAAFALIKRAAELIDMSKHSGEHPRMGATDVCPFIPVQGVNMEECVDLAKRLARRVGQELNIPVYLYEAAAATVERRSLAYLRQGEYEGLAEKLKNPDMQPDFGPAAFNSRSGAMVIGARPFLIAYNLNLNTKNKRLASEIAFRLRESGYKKKDAEGKIIVDKEGKPIIEPGMFAHCRAVGWYIEDFGIAQVSINLTNYEVTPIHAVFDAGVSLAQERGLRITGSEIVGLVPKQALLDSGKYYLTKQGSTLGVPEAEILDIAIKSLGLSELYPFKLEDKVIEERFEEKGGLTSLSVNKFADVLSSDSPAPGGGSVSALAGSLAASLASMVSALSFGKCKEPDAEKKKRFETWGVRAQELKKSLLTLVELDSKSFDAVMLAFKLKPKDPAGEEEKKRKVIEAYIEATKIPLRVVKQCVECIELATFVAREGLQTALSDSAVAGQIAYAGALGASYNVKINLKEIVKLIADSSRKEASQFVEQTKAELANELNRAGELLKTVSACVDEKLA